jgi:hypothetical protein
VFARNGEARRMSERTEQLKKIQTYGFSAYDMLLYLDTHPKDKKAFAIFRYIVKKAFEDKK